MISGGVYGELTEKITLWIKNILEKAGAQGVVIGLSGGIDSGVVAALCTRAAGAENVLGLVMPCGSIPEDTRDGHLIARHLGIHAEEIDLAPVFNAFAEAGGLDTGNTLNMANVKSRLRMTMEYAFSRNRLVAGTGNRSEIMTGYWTKWGDGAADFLPVAELWKDEVKELAGYLELPQWLLDRVPSAGLWPNQSDENEMGVTYIEIKKYFTRGPQTVSADASNRIAKLFALSVHKREQIPFCCVRGWLDERK
jgi:NAD+ synthase